MARVLVSDPIDDAGVQKLGAAGYNVDVKTGLSPDELAAIIGDYDALIVRSETKVTKEGYNEEKDICARGYFVFVAIDDKGKPTEVPELTVRTKKEKRNSEEIPPKLTQNAPKVKKNKSRGSSEGDT